jgi:hypothetical protein
MSWYNKIASRERVSVFPSFLPGYHNVYFLDMGNKKYRFLIDSYLADDLKYLAEKPTGNKKYPDKNFYKAFNKAKEINKLEEVRSNFESKKVKKQYELNVIDKNIEDINSHIMFNKALSNDEINVLVNEMSLLNQSKEEAEGVLENIELSLSRLQ